MSTLLGLTASTEWICRTPKRTATSPTTEPFSPSTIGSCRCALSKASRTLAAAIITAVRAPRLRCAARCCIAAMAADAVATAGARPAAVPRGPSCVIAELSCDAADRCSSASTAMESKRAGALGLRLSRPWLDLLCRRGTPALASAKAPLPAQALAPCTLCAVGRERVEEASISERSSGQPAAWRVRAEISANAAAPPFAIGSDISFAISSSSSASLVSGASHCSSLPSSRK
mmetsp:Transcript_17994/g.54162  ORF Transcript_17994/g.54162 Transcript_17994/m.54162 type:complete len:232 (-) Transcript_17994:757-1452(-)